MFDTFRSHDEDDHQAQRLDDGEAVRRPGLDGMDVASMSPTLPGDPRGVFEDET
jgi:hypothetical protein